MTPTDKLLLMNMLDRAQCDYAVSDKCGNSICIAHRIEFMFDSSDMLEHVETMEGWL